MTCRFCSYGFCPYCRAALPTVHSGHRLPLEDFRFPQARNPLRSDLASRLETKGEGTDQEPGAVGDHRVNVVGHHAPSISGERVTDAQDFVPKISAFVSE